MLREVNLVEHLPLFIQVYREIGHIMTAENPEFQFLCDESERIKNNQFIQTCDLEGIIKFEKLLNMNHYPDDTLESRISKVLVRWNDIIPYTLKVLLMKLDTLCGAGNYTVVPNFNVYKLFVKLALQIQSDLEEVQYLLDSIVPVNIETKIIMFNTYTMLRGFTHQHLSNYIHKEVREEIL